MKLVTFFILVLCPISYTFANATGNISVASKSWNSETVEELKKLVDSNPDLNEAEFKAEISKHFGIRSDWYQAAYRYYVGKRHPLKVDQTVLVQNSYIGKTRGSSSTLESVAVEFRGYDRLYSYYRTEILAEVETIAGFRKGDRIRGSTLLTSSSVGTIEHLFEKEYAAVSYEGYPGKLYVILLSNFERTE